MYINDQSKSTGINSQHSSQTDHTTNAGSQNSNWYLSMARAWGNALDREGEKLVNASLSLSDDATVGDTIMVSAQAHKLSFMAQAASSTSNSIGQALETIAKKQ